MRANLPDHTFFIGKNPPFRPDVEVRELIGSGNDGHVLRAFVPSIRKPVVCKIIPRSNLNLELDEFGVERWMAEVHKADALRNSSVVKFESVGEWKALESDIDCVGLIAEYVEGKNLSQYIKDHKGDINIPFIRDWLATMLNLFYEMGLIGVTHGDLHAGNILVEDRSSFELLGSRYAFRVTDFGVGEATSQRRFKDDYLQLAEILASLLRSLEYPTLSPRDKYIFNILRHHFVARHLVEQDPTIDLVARQPRELLTRLQQIDQEFEQDATQTSTALLSPFDFLSCEQIGDAPDLLRALYSDQFLGLPEIESRNNVVVTGPRGCGKSTVFRNLSLQHKLRIAEAEPDSTPYVGVYYRCDDLYFNFPRYSNPANPAAIDTPIHFLTATLLATLLESLDRWANSFFEREYRDAETQVCRSIWELIGIPIPKVPGTLSLKALVSAMNKQRLKAIERQRFAHDTRRVIGECFGPEIIFNVCTALSHGFPFLKGRPIYYFIDDYSSPKISRELQASLNRVFMQRHPVCFFKLSTESPVSFVTEDIDGKVYVESREFILFNLGLVYLGSEVNQKLLFVEDVFRRRLIKTREAFPAQNLTDLVGSNPRINNNQLALEIRNGSKPSMWGKEVLCHLCSGDIHYIISLVGDMVRASGGVEGLSRRSDTFRVAAPTQNDAIRSAAGTFLKNLRGVPECGEHLVAIVESFGNVAYSHMKYLDSKNEEGAPPKQATRIEPYEPIHLSSRSKALYNELLRYSVFIEDFRGKSRRGSVVPRLYMRRFLIPHFNLTFSTRDSIELEPSEFEAFISDPKGFENKLRLKSAEDAKRLQRREDANEQQLPLPLEEHRI